MLVFDPDAGANQSLRNGPPRFAIAAIGQADIQKASPTTLTLRRI